MGANQYMTKTIAAKPESQRELFSNLFFYKLVSTVGFPVLMVAIGTFIYPNLLLELFLIAITFSLIEMLSFFRGAFQGHQLFGYDAIMANAEKTVLILLLSALLLTSINLELFLVARFTSVAIACLIALVFLWKKKLVYIPQFNRKALKNIIRQSFPYAFMAMLYTLHERVDAVMVEKISGNYEAGIYAAAYRWLDLFMMYLWTILPFFFAKFAHHEMKKEDINKLIKAGVGITSVPLIIVFSFALFYGPIFFEFIMTNSTPQEIERMSSTLTILLFTLLAQGMFAILSTFLTSRGFTKYVNGIIIGSIVINITLNSIFIPEYGTQAAAWTTFISTIFASIGNIIFIKKNQLAELPYIVWLKNITLLIIAISGYFILKNYLDWIINMIIVSLTVLGISYIFKLLDIRTIKHL